jgi:hypothetical protein
VRRSAQKESGGEGEHKRDLVQRQLLEIAKGLVEWDS